MAVSWERYETASMEMLMEIKKEAESYLGAQLTAALSSNQRGMSLIALLAAATIVIAGTGLSMLLGTTKTPQYIAIGSGALVTGAGFLIAMALANITVMPSTFWYAGSAPNDWEQDILEDGKSFKESIAEQLKHYDERICKNTLILERNARLITAAVWAAWLSLISGVGVVLWVYFFRFS